MEGSSDPESRITNLKSIVTGLKTQIDDLNDGLDNFVQEGMEVAKVEKEMIEDFKEKTRKISILYLKKFLQQESFLKKSYEEYTRKWRP